MSQQNSVKPDVFKKDIVIIGTGFGGIGMAIKLKQAGHDDFVILEKGASSGGCWRENSYPGAACDVPSLLYSFSFEPKSDWTRSFAPQAEIQAYLQHCEKKYGLSQNIQFNSEVASAQFDEVTGRWDLLTKDGRHINARIFISACGQLSQPAMPTLNGIENFNGKVMHSAKWDHSYDLNGKKVAVIGTGASAIQFIPEVAKQAGTLHVLQRSAPYVLPKPDKAYSSIKKALFKHVPLLQKAHRLALYLAHEIRFLGFSHLQYTMTLAKGKCLGHMKRIIKDSELREKFIPNYGVGCKRILISNNYFPTFNRENVNLETTGIDHLSENKIVLTDGRKLDVDTIIYGTGFKATEFLTPMKVTGLQGKSLNQEWHNGAEAYLGMTVKDFPNFYMLYGPNTNLGHNSIIYMLESQFSYILDAVSALNKDNVKYLNVLGAKQSGFNNKVQKKLKETVWEKGCDSWYKTDTGKNTVNWPDFTFVYRHKTRNLNLNDYHVITSMDIDKQATAETLTRKQA